VKVYLDDRRPAPDDSWTLVATPEEAVELLKTGGVTEISLDYDLGLWDAEGKGDQRNRRPRSGIGEAALVASLPA
jgi:hypothetical protein